MISSDVIIMIRNVILAIGWPVLVAGSVYLFLKGRSVYKMVRGSLVGRITKILILTMLVEMYSLGVVSTALMYSDLRGVYLVLPVFVIWFVMFIMSLRVLISAGREAQGVTQ